MASDVLAETIALAALFQSAAQIQKVARLGTIEENAIAPLMRALIITNPRTCEDVYAPKSILPGLKQLTNTLGPREATSAKNAELLKLAFSIISLETSLMKQKMIFSKLDNQVDILRNDVLNIHPNYEEADERTLLDYDIIQMYSQIYSSLISPNFPKLIIYGEESYLRKTEFQEMIRALLLSGIRACVLWNQVGGKRYSLMFRYKDIIECASNLIRNNS